MKISSLSLLLVLACASDPPTPPVPTYDPSTLLVENQTGVVVEFLAHCCGGQSLPATLQPTNQICIIMHSVYDVRLVAGMLGRTYEDSLPDAHSSPAWTWTLLPDAAELRAATTPCG